MESNPGTARIHVAKAARRGVVFGLMVSAWTLAGAVQGQSFSGEFPVPTAGVSPSMIVAGPDGNLWFTESLGSQIGQITPNGVITEFPVRSPAAAITVGSDRNLWFTQSSSRLIGRMTPHGEIDEFPVPTPTSTMFGITAGPDGALWFTEFNEDKIGRITTSGQITEFTLPRLLPGNPPNIRIFSDRKPLDIVAGPDGNLWFTETFVNMIGRITPSAVITEFYVPTADCPETDFFGNKQRDCGLRGITAGPDGNLWYLKAKPRVKEGQQPPDMVGRITTTGVVTEFPIPTYFAAPFGMTSGPDGNLWFTESSTNKIGRITTNGGIQEFVIPTDDSGPRGITTGPDGYLWFAEARGNKIGRMTPSSTGPCVADSTTLCLRDNRFKVQLTWSKPSEASHPGTAIHLTEDTGYFWFLNPANVELVIKVLDGGNGHFWVFYGALSSLQYTITVTDTVTGTVKPYENLAGTLASVADTSAFGPSNAIGDTDPEVSPEDIEARSAEELYALYAALTLDTDAPKAVAADACTPGGTTLCLNQSRFQVSVDWEVPSQGRSGHGAAVPVTGDTGYFWFFNGDNVELVIKVLTGNNGHYWVFYGALSNVQYTITVTDTQTGVVKPYTNPSGTLASVADIYAFPY